MTSTPSDLSKNTTRTGFRLFRTGLLIAGSALFGGLAVALWDRKTLSGLRQLPELPKKPSALPDGDEE